MKTKEYSDIIIGTKYNSLTVKKEAPKTKPHREYICVCDCGNELIIRATILRCNRMKSCGCHMLPKLINKRFGKLTVIKFEDRKRGKHRWLCKCDCGKENIVVGEVLLRGDTKSCGCLISESVSKAKLKNLINKTFGALTVLDRLSDIGARRIKWWCKCSCGKYSAILGENLVSGNTTSCGKCHITYHKRKKAYKKSRPEQGTQIYKAWRRAVYQRDKFRCIACGKKNKLNAHHLNGWSWSILERYIVRNGVTLCSGPNGCHDKFHNIYGRGKNTIGQFTIFLFQYFNKHLFEIINKI